LANCIFLPCAAAQPSFVLSALKQAALLHRVERCVTTSLHMLWFSCMATGYTMGLMHGQLQATDSENMNPPPLAAVLRLSGYSGCHCLKFHLGSIEQHLARSSCEMQYGCLKHFLSPWDVLLPIGPRKWQSLGCEGTKLAKLPNVGGSVAMTYGIWHMAHQTWHMAFAIWNIAHGRRQTAYGAGRMAYCIQLMACGIWHMAFHSLLVGTVLLYYISHHGVNALPEARGARSHEGSPQRHCTWYMACATWHMAHGIPLTPSGNCTAVLHGNGTWQWHMAHEGEALLHVP